MSLLPRDGECRALGDGLPGGFGRHRGGGIACAVGCHAPAPGEGAVAVRRSAAVKALASGETAIAVFHHQAHRGIRRGLDAHLRVTANRAAGAGKGDCQRHRRWRACGC